MRSSENSNSAWLSHQPSGSSALSCSSEATIAVRCGYAVRHDGELRLEVRAGVGVAVGHGEELLGEAQHHAAEGVQAPVRQVIAQTALDHGREHRLEVRHQARRHLGPRAHELRTPPVAEHHLARRQTSGAQRRPPPGDGLVSRDGLRDLGHQAFGEAVEQPLLARDVVVERHRLDAQVGGDPAHRHRPESVDVRDAMAVASTRSG